MPNFWLRCKAKAFEKLKYKRRGIKNLAFCIFQNSNFFRFCVVLINVITITLLEIVKIEGRKMMKKVLILPVLLASTFVFGNSAQAATGNGVASVTAANAPQVRV